LDIKKKQENKFQQVEYIQVIGSLTLSDWNM